MEQHNTTEQEFNLYWDRYFDDIEGYIEMLNRELEVTESESERADDFKEHIAYLKERMIAGDVYVDNDTTVSPDAWKTLPTFTEQEAMEKFKEWDD